MKLWSKQSDLQIAQFPTADINEPNSAAVASLLASEGWKALELELNRRLRFAGSLLVNGPRDELPVAQGYYKGFEAAIATAYEIVGAQQEQPEDEIDIETEFYAKQQALGDQRLDSY